MTKLILFDIDGTLIHTGGAGMIAMNRAFETITGLVDGVQGIQCAGRTDIGILKDALTRAAIETDGDFFEAFLKVYPSELEVALKESAGHVKPGIPELLDLLVGMEEIRVGLLTGNVEQGARAKLTHFKLVHYFLFGAYGSDHEDRNELLPIALRKFSELETIVVEPRNCVIIGDTPLDIACAQVHGAKSLAVATGPYSCDELSSFDPDVVLNDLSDTDGVLHMLLKD